MLRLARRSLALAGLCGVLVAFAAWSRADDAAGGGIYSAGAQGYDASNYQCGQQPPGSFGVVAVTNGRAFYRNPCLQSLFAAASRLPGPPSVYMNLNAAVGTTAFNGNDGPRGICSKKDNACRAYNYGYNAAADAFIYARSQGASSSVWWLDVETANSWQRQTSLNRETVQGAIDYLTTQARVIVGVYSTSYQWRVITGGMQLAIPNWVAGATSADSAPAKCSSPFTGSGASVWLVQYPNGAFDGDYAC